MMKLYNFDSKYIRVVSPHIANVLRNRVDYDDVTITVEKNCNLSFTEVLPFSYNKWRVSLPKKKISITSISFLNLKNSLDVDLDLTTQEGACCTIGFDYDCSTDLPSIIADKITEKLDIGTSQPIEDVDTGCLEECNYKILEVLACECEDCSNDDCCELDFFNIPDYLVPISINYMEDSEEYSAKFHIKGAGRCFIVGTELWIAAEGLNNTIETGVYRIKTSYNRGINLLIEDDNYIFIDNKENIVSLSKDALYLHYSLTQASNSGCDYDKVCTIFETLEEIKNEDNCCT